MATNLVQWFVYCVVGIFAAYVAGRALPPGTRYLAVIRFAGVTAFLGYALALWQNHLVQARMDHNDADRWQPSRPLRDPCAARRGRNGRGHVIG